MSDDRGPPDPIRPEPPFMSQHKPHPALDYRIEPETEADRPAVDELIAASFGPERHKRTVYRFRVGRDPIPDLAFVARVDDGGGRSHLVGSLNFWEVRADGVALPLLGPLAVLPDLRGQGVGRALVGHGLERARAAGWPGVLIVGDPGYYAPYGFSVDAVAGLSLPGPVGPLTFMGLEYAPGALSRLTGAVTPGPER